MKKQMIFEFARVGLYGGVPMDAGELAALRKKASARESRITTALKKEHLPGHKDAPGSKE